MKVREPVILSVSRATDIPAFYSTWFFNRLRIGYADWVNPYNGVCERISFKKVRVIVFWSKNPAPLLPHLKHLKALGINLLLHYTLNDYQQEFYEPGLPALSERIATMKQFASRLSPAQILWRFDPLLLTDKIDIELMLERVSFIADKVSQYTDHLIFSFADPNEYISVARNLASSGVTLFPFTKEQKVWFMQQLVKRNKKWGLKLSVCADESVLPPDGVERAICIDARLLAQQFEDDQALIRFLGYEDGVDLFGEWPEPGVDLRDRGQRKGCRCIVSKDIGAYNSCPHACVYCYANHDSYRVYANYEYHNPLSDSLLGPNI